MKLKFSLTTAASEWGIDRKTLRKRLVANDVEVSVGKKYTLREIDRAVHGDKDGEELRLVKEKADQTALANAESRKETVSLESMRKHQAIKAMSCKQAVMSLTILTEEQKDIVLHTIANVFSVESPKGKEPKQDGL